MERSLLSQLREKSREAHSRLDSALSFGDVAKSPQSYQAYLEAFQSGLEAVLSRTNWQALEERQLPDAKRRWARYAALAQDSGKPLDVKINGQGTVAASAGQLYVLEGSIHGGAYLLKSLRSEESFQPENTRFLEAFGEDNPAVWKSFLTWLEELELDDEQANEACDAAVRAFQHFEEAFSPEAEKAC